MTARFPKDAVAERVAAVFGLAEPALLGSGGEATVYALDAARVLRVYRPGPERPALERRAGLLAELATNDAALPFGIPRVLELDRVLDRWVTIEPRWPGRSLTAALRDVRSGAREVLLRSYLDSARRLTSIPFSRPFYGDLLADDAIREASFRRYLERRARRSLDASGEPLAQLDAGELARALPDTPYAAEGESRARPAFVYLDAYPDNVLVDAERVTAIVDFGGVSIAGEPRFGAVVSATYLMPPDQPVAQAWLQEQGLTELYEPVRRWIAAFWSFATDDAALYRWCRSVLLG